MTFYELFHSVIPELLLENIRQINPMNDVKFLAQTRFLTTVLNTMPEEDDGVPIHVIRDRYFKPVVALDTSLEAEITLSKILARQVMVSEHLKHLSPGMIAAHCYCALPVRILLCPNCVCKVSQAFDQDSNSIVTKVYDNILSY